MPDRGCASLGGHMGGKDDVERWTSLYKGFTRPGRGKKLPEPDDATLRRLREVESRAAPVSIAPPAPTTNRRERPSAGHATPAADPPPPPSSANDDTPPPTDELPAAATNAPAPASDVQPRRRRQNKAELAEAQAAAKREAVRVAVRHAMGARSRRTRTCDGSRRPPSSRPRSRGRGRWRWARGMARGMARTTAHPPIRGTDRPTRVNRPRGGRNPRRRRRDSPASPPPHPAPVAHVGAARRLPHVPTHARQAQTRAPARIKNVRSRRPLPSGGTGAAPVPRARRASRARRVRLHGPARDGARGEGVGVARRGAARGPQNGRRAQVRDSGRRPPPPGPAWRTRSRW